MNLPPNFNILVEQIDREVYNLDGELFQAIQLVRTRLTFFPNNIIQLQIHHSLIELCEEKWERHMRVLGETPLINQLKLRLIEIAIALDTRSILIPSADRFDRSRGIAFRERSLISI